MVPIIIKVICHPKELIRYWEKIGQIVIPTATPENITPRSVVLFFLGPYEILIIGSIAPTLIPIPVIKPKNRYNCKYEVVNPHKIIPIQTRIPQIKPAYIVLNFLMKIAATGLRILAVSACVVHIDEEIVLVIWK